MAYGGSAFGEVPYGSQEEGSLEKNVVNAPTINNSVEAITPIVAVQYQFTTRKHNALERSSPCPE